MKLRTQTPVPPKKKKKKKKKGYNQNITRGTYFKEIIIKTRGG
jgi:hypothetical protein